MVFSVHVDGAALGSHGYVQKKTGPCGIGCSVEQTVAIEPVQSFDVLQYWPTPLELPVSPGWPHSE